MKNIYNTFLTFTKRLIGQILVDGGFVTHEAVVEALKLQKHTNGQLGTILVQMGALDRTDLEGALALQRHLSSLDDAVKVAAGIRQLLGELLTQTGRITQEQLGSALKEQKKTGEKIGTILVRHGFLTEEELESLLKFQEQQATEIAQSAPLKLGELLVTTGQITHKQLEEALRNQQLSHKKIGEILIEAGYAKPEQVSRGLRLQHMLLTASLAAILSLAAIPGSNIARAGSVSTKMTVTANVIARTNFKVVHQIPAIAITSDDIRKGYIDIRGASRVEVKSNNPTGYMLGFHGMVWPFKEIHIQGLQSEVQINSGNIFVHQPYVRGTVILDLSYKLLLAADTKPGMYTWPLSITSQPI